MITKKLKKLKKPIVKNESVKINDDLFNVIIKIQEKLNSPLFTDGLKSINEKVQNIEDILYDPDNGIYSRIKSLETVVLEKLQTIKNDSENSNQIIVSEKEKLKINEERINVLEKKQSELITWRNTITWVFAVIILPTAGFVIKTIWNFLSTHVQIS